MKLVELVVKYIFEVQAFNLKFKKKLHHKNHCLVEFNKKSPHPKLTIRVGAVFC